MNGKKNIRPTYFYDNIGVPAFKQFLLLDIMPTPIVFQIKRLCAFSIEYFPYYCDS